MYLSEDDIFSLFDLLEHYADDCPEYRSAQEKLYAAKKAPPEFTDPEIHLFLDCIKCYHDNADEDLTSVHHSLAYTSDVLRQREQLYELQARLRQTLLDHYQSGS